jgi:uncharacterized protein YjbI with pentapeptide repeats
LPPEERLKERLNLLKALTELPRAQFEEVIFAFDPPSGVIPSSVSAQGNRVAALLSWIEGPTGPGLDRLRELLEDYFPVYSVLERNDTQAALDRRPAEILAEGVQSWNEWRASNPTLTPELRSINLRNLDLTGVNFFSVDLSKADLSLAILKNADLRGSDLKGAILVQANLLDANLRNANLIEANFFEADLRDTDLRDTDLSYANLLNTNLRASQVLGAILKNADLTGACIEDWQIGSSTKLQQVKCEYIFRQYDSDTNNFFGRLPVNPNTNFQIREFEKWMQVRLSALDTIDITFTEGIDWQALFASLQGVRQQHPDSHVSMQSIGESEGIYVVRLKVETEATGEALKELRAEVETQTKALYQRQLAEAQDEIKALERSLDKTLEKLAMASGDNSTNLNFYGPTGNVAGTNYGSMTAYINQNSDEIARLLTGLREKAQSFPEEQKEEALMEIDDLESDLQTPEKQDPKRIGKRLKRLMAAGTAAIAISGSAATASGNLNEFATNVLELGEKIGFTQENIQPVAE